jgi:hypothetical protein
LNGSVNVSLKQQGNATQRFSFVNQTMVPASGKWLTLRDDVRCDLPGVTERLRIRPDCKRFSMPRYDYDLGKAGSNLRIDAAFPTKFESHSGHTIVWQKFLACVQKAAQDACMKAIPKARPRNVTPFVLEGCWTLDALDQPTMRLLRRIADRERVKVADVIHGALELFVAKCEAEADLEKKIIKFPMSPERWQSTDH